jgi:hypothetical protein
MLFSNVDLAVHCFDGGLTVFYDAGKLIEFWGLEKNKNFSGAFE